MNPEAPRSAKVEVVLKDGGTLSHFTPYAYGTKQNPMDTESVNAKARGLLEPVLGDRGRGSSSGGLTNWKM